MAKRSTRHIEEAGQRLKEKPTEQNLKKLTDALDRFKYETTALYNLAIVKANK